MQDPHQFDKQFLYRIKAQVLSDSQTLEAVLKQYPNHEHRDEIRHKLLRTKTFLRSIDSTIKFMESFDGQPVDMTKAPTIEGRTLAMGGDYSLEYCGLQYFEPAMVPLVAIIHFAKKHSAEKPFEVSFDDFFAQYAPNHPVPKELQASVLNGTVNFWNAVCLIYRHVGQVVPIKFKPFRLKVDAEKRTLEISYSAVFEHLIQWRHGMKWLAQAFLTLSESIDPMLLLRFVLEVFDAEKVALPFKRYEYGSMTETIDELTATCQAMIELKFINDFEWKQSDDYCTLTLIRDAFAEGKSGQ
ncbi:MAG: hypothetical protein Q4E62_03965 [Sutterellaceae bacterium]|nr:hypothetical protein [Sutterellaceae bacterium]